MIGEALKSTPAKLEILIAACSIFLLAITPRAYAHKVNVFAYEEDGIVYAESFFPDGRRVKNGLIEVYDNRGQKLLEGRTDGSGLFNFKRPKEGELKIVINASLGHRNSYILSPEVPAAKRAMPGPERVPFSKIISGLGYIFGISGMAFFFLSAKKAKEGINKDASTRNR